MRRSLVLLALGCLALGGSASAGLDAPAPADLQPSWMPDGTSLLYLAERDAYSLHTVAADGSADRRLAPLGQYSDFEPSPDGTQIAYSAFEGGAYRMFVIAGGQRRDLGPTGAPTSPRWSPDARRLAFGREGALVVVDAATGAVSFSLPGLWPLAWSPDGRQLAAGGPTALEVVEPGTGARRTLANTPSFTSNPITWSPDGASLAVVRGASDASRVEIVRVDGGGSETISLRAPGAPAGEVARSPASWTPDGRSLVYGASAGHTFSVYRLDLASRVPTRVVAVRPPGPPGSFVMSSGDVALSPDGTRVAFVHGGECREKAGLHVVGLDGRGLRRLTNGCRVNGTPRADRLRGTGGADVIIGFAGDDRLVGAAEREVGDTLDGGLGDDTLVGTFYGDELRGGAGADRLLAGRSGDLLIGGSGRDVLDGQGGIDVLDAFDGYRDTVVCGTNVARTPERDVAYVDRFDRVSRDCETVIRRKRLS